MTVTYHVGDTRAVLAALPDASIDLVLTSPPFLGLRSYLPPDSPDKHLEIGAEATPGDYIDTLLDVVEDCCRVLAPHGSLVFEIGDSYAGSGGSGGDYGEGGMREGQAKWSGTGRSARESSAKIPWKGERAGWPLDKSLCLIPESFRWALVYGRNPFNGRETPRWRARNVVRWVRPNPPVGALGDKFRPATSDMVIACKARSRYFDLDAVRVPADEANKRPSVLRRTGIPGRSDQVANPLGADGQRIISNPAGAPPLDWWKISPSGYPGSHYATWPPELLTVPIKAMCPERVCLTCGMPSERITERTEAYAAARAAIGDFKAGRGRESGLNGTRQYVTGNHMDRAENVTIGWTDCGHNTWRPGVVLDPFGGTGTTGLVAAGHGRDAILIDLDPRNVTLAHQRLGMLLTDVVDHTTTEATA